MVGARQTDASQRIVGGMHLRPINTTEAQILNAPTGAFNVLVGQGSPGASRVAMDQSPNAYGTQSVVTFDSANVTRTSSETRPTNVAFAPRIHI